MEGSDSRGSYRFPNLQMKSPRALTGLNFRSRFAFRTARATAEISNQANPAPSVIEFGRKDRKQ
jgi:hypothetical protein